MVKGMDEVMGVDRATRGTTWRRRLDSRLRSRSRECASSCPIACSARGSKCRYGVFARLPPGLHSVLLCLEVTVDAHRDSVEQEHFECVAKVGMKAPLPATFVLGYLMLRDECLGDAASARS